QAAPAVQVNVFIKEVRVREVRGAVEIGDMLLHPDEIIPLLKIAVVGIGQPKVKVYVQFIFNKILVGVGVQRIVVYAAVESGGHRNSPVTLSSVGGPVILIGRAEVGRDKIFLVQAQFKAEPVARIGLQIHIAALEGAVVGRHQEGVEFSEPGPPDAVFVSGGEIVIFVE